MKHDITVIFIFDGQFYSIYHEINIDIINKMKIDSIIDTIKIFFEDESNSHIAFHILILRKWCLTAFSDDVDSHKKNGILIDFGLYSNETSW